MSLQLVEQEPLTKEQRLAKARLQLVKTENQLGVSPNDALNGKVWHLDGSHRSLINTLQCLQNPQQWVCALGVEDFGWVAAAEAGIDLEHFLLVKPPADKAGEVLGQLVDGFEVTICAPIFLRPAEQRRIAAKVRQRKNLLLTMLPWVGVSRSWNSNATSGFSELRQVG